MRIPLYQLDAFAEQPFQGNPAAVCPLQEWLPEELMQRIAEENNLAETAFTVPTGDGFAIRWFTPVTEVDLCGHATLAAAYALFMTKAVDGSIVRFSSRSGPLTVEHAHDRLTLDFPAQPLEACDPPEALVSGLQVTPSETFRGMDYLAVLQDEESIRRLTPDMGALKRLDRRGLIVTAPGEQTDFVCRFFAPNFGIDEDPVTGSAYCALMPYWSARLKKNQLNAVQLSRRTGRVRCELKGRRVLISGRVVPYLEGTILV